MKSHSRTNRDVAQIFTFCHESEAMLKWLGRQTIQIISGLGDFALFTGKSFRSAVNSRRLPRRIARAVYEQGACCLPVILIVGMFTGLVLGLQGYYVLNRFGSDGLLGTLVSLSLVREMAPVLAALMIVGQAGSALAAELGIQRNSEQIVALETMGVSSHGYLVAPRLIASLVVFPLQTALFVAVGVEAEGGADAHGQKPEGGCLDETFPDIPRFHRTFHRRPVNSRICAEQQ